MNSMNGMEGRPSIRNKFERDLLYGARMQYISKEELSEEEAAHRKFPHRPAYSMRPPNTLMTRAQARNTRARQEQSRKMMSGSNDGCKPGADELNVHSVVNLRAWRQQAKTNIDRNHVSGAKRPSSHKALEKQGEWEEVTQAGVTFW
eukprot:CAMPEP_0185759192 /NCGR_PEP_ID=MMETSP1174-20130828/17897_1 /TAXON_ID=35687 /ORGANISM="Dictyocha speculum, Strain CCMP1381" /LENGTH=146 /DNA_ID=CAMNT_0028439395 /DNA_START=15 /DNA_END=452 /DNA_ORIENTATION=-